MLTGILSALNPDRAEVVKYLDVFFFARIALVPTFTVLMPIIMATPGRDGIAREIQEGALKLYMSRSRAELRSS